MVQKINKDEVYLFAQKFFANFTDGDDPYERLLAYKKENDIIAFISYSVIYERAEINFIAVEKSFRNKGIAQKLIDAMLLDIEDTCENVSLEVSINNKAAINLYLKNDFCKKGIRKNYYADGDAYLLIKEMR